MQVSSDGNQLSLEEQAYRRLRQALVEGVFTPGQKLFIRRIAVALSTSPPADVHRRRARLMQDWSGLTKTTPPPSRHGAASNRPLQHSKAATEPSR